MKREILRAIKDARHLISKPENWTRQQMARNEFGLTVPYDSPQATRFCAVGALRAVATTYIVADSAREYLSETVSRQLSASVDIMTFNDATNHYGILQAFDRAIDELEAQIEVKAPKAEEPVLVVG